MAARGGAGRAGARGAAGGGLAAGGAARAAGARAAGRRAAAARAEGEDAGAAAAAPEAAAPKAVAVQEDDGGFWVVPGYRVTGIHQKAADGSYALSSNWFKDFAKPGNWKSFNENTAGGSGDSSTTGQGNIAFAAIISALAAFYYQGGGANTTAMAWILVPTLILVLRGSREGPAGYNKPSYGKAFVPFTRSSEEGKKAQK